MSQADWAIVASRLWNSLIAHPKPGIWENPKKTPTGFFLISIILEVQMKIWYVFINENKNESCLFCLRLLHTHFRIWFWSLAVTFQFILGRVRLRVEFQIGNSNLSVILWPQIQIYLGWMPNLIHKPSMDLTLFLPAMGGISPHMSVTWQQPVGIGLSLKGIMHYLPSYVFIPCPWRQIYSKNDKLQLEVPYIVGICKYIRSTNTVAP